MSFAARYRGRCASPACDRSIDVGDEVVFVDQELRHDECALDEGVPDAPVRRICTTCFTEVSVAGECLC